MVSRRLIDAYQAFLEALSEEERNVEVAILPYGAFTRQELLEHLEKEDEIGQEAVQAFLDATRAELNEQGVRAMTPDAVEEATVESFYSAAGLVKEQRG